MANIQCPGCGTIVTVDPAAGQTMGCPNCRTPLGVAGPSAAQSAVQGRSGEVPIASPPPPGAPAAQLPQQSTPQPLSPRPSAAAGGSPNGPDQIAVEAAVQAAAQAAATQAVAAHVAAQATRRPAAPVATPVGRAAPVAAAVPQDGTQIKASRRAVRRKSTNSAANLIAVLTVAGLAFVVLGGGLIWYLNVASKPKVTSTPTESTDETSKTDRPVTNSKTNAKTDPKTNADTGAKKTVPATSTNIEVQVQSVEFDAPRWRSAASVPKVLQYKCLVVRIKITNSGSAAVEYQSWHLTPYTAIDGKSPDETKLVDDRSRVYPAVNIPGAVTFNGHVPKASIAMGESVVDALLFRVPSGFSPGDVKSLRLTLSGKAVGQENEFELKIDGGKIVEL